MGKGLSYRRCKVCGGLKPMANNAFTCQQCIDDGYKYCKWCDRVLPIGAFSYNIQCLCYNATCNECKNAKKKHLISTNEEAHQKALAANRASMYKARHSVEGNARMRAHLQNYRNGLLGTYSAEEWLECCEFFDNKCAYCGSTDKLTVDHIAPVSKGGANRIYNLVPACQHCNSSKNNRSLSEFYRATESFDEQKLNKIGQWVHLKRIELMATREVI